MKMNQKKKATIAHSTSPNDQSVAASVQPIVAPFRRHGRRVFSYFVAP
jgi:hypothetical protein